MHWNDEPDSAYSRICNAALHGDRGNESKLVAEIRAALQPMLDENKRLRQALQHIAAIENKDFGLDWEEIEEARGVARTALIGGDAQ